MDSPDSIKLGGVILAAGEGRRFGGNKALAQLDRMSFLELVVRNLKQIYCHPIVVVAGSDFESVMAECRRVEVDCVVNKEWQAGQFSSLKTGLAEMNDIDGVMIALVDHPAIRFDTYRDLKTAFEFDRDKILIPVYNERKGHPIIIPAGVMGEIIEAGNELTMRDILRNHTTSISHYNCDDSGILQDIDTRDDLERL